MEVTRSRSLNLPIFFFVFVLWLEFVANHHWYNIFSVTLAEMPKRDNVPTKEQFDISFIAELYL
jgi:hypothetical protein